MKQLAARPEASLPGFWLFQSKAGLNTIETLKTKPMVQIVLGASAFLFTVIASRLHPLAEVPAFAGPIPVP